MYKNIRSYSVKNFTRLFHKKEQGFIITYEIIITWGAIAVFLMASMWIMSVMNTERFFNTILVSVATQSSRWGGVNTDAYTRNVSSIPILTSAQNYLDKIAPGYYPQIVGTPNKITYDQEPINIDIYYHLPSFFAQMGKVSVKPDQTVDMYNIDRNMHMHVAVYSIMGPGHLL